MPAPANDNFANAQALSTTLPGSLPGLTTFDATEEGGEPELFTSTGHIEQGIWFTFTPTSTGWYRFRIVQSSMVYNGTHSESSGGLNIALFKGGTDVDTLAEATFGNLYGPSTFDSGFTDPNWINVHNPTVYGLLTSGVTYYIKITSSFGTTPNRSTVDFDFEWDEISPAPNADFANRETITGASGSEDIEWGVQSEEVDEPFTFYWNEDVLLNQATVWFDWTCPSSGWYEFEVENAKGIDTRLGIYTGSTLVGLTPIARNEMGGESNLGTSLLRGKTVIRFNATNGTSYKLQVSANADTVISGDDTTSTLTWASAAAPTGDTLATAPEGSFDYTRVDNYGNTNDDLPPNGVTRLSPHDDWWYFDGAIGRSKWWKYAPDDLQVVRVRAETFVDGIHATYSEYGLLAYISVGDTTDVGDLIAATTDAAEDAVMLGYSDDPATTLASADFMDITVDGGANEVLWLCLVGLYDEDYNEDTVVGTVDGDCPQTALDLKFGDADVPEEAQANDDRNVAPDVFPWNLAKSQFGNFYIMPHAVQHQGHTFFATSEVGEPAHAGFGPTRSVWYSFYFDEGGDWKIWVESDVNCVLALYELGTFGALGDPVASDDDSGTGNWPELTLAIPSDSQYWIAVDSKTEGQYTLKIQRQSDPGETPPVNDNIADAIDIASIPFTDTGTTVDATAEPFEVDADELGTGQKDSVWYKYVAPADGMFKVWCDGISQINDWYIYVDIFKGTDPNDLERYPDPPPVWDYGVFYADAISDPGENFENGLVFPVFSGETYYIRVQTESGGSEDFTIHMDEGPIYVKITPSAIEEMHGTLLDDEEIYVSITPHALFADNFDDAIIPVNLEVSGSEFMAFEYTDSAIIYVDLQFMGGECFSAHTGLMMDAEADPRWIATADCRWQVMDAEQRWEVVDVQSEGVHC